jgi:hypothetical protein
MWQQVNNQTTNRIITQLHRFFFLEAVKVLLSKNVSADSTNVLFLWLFSSANAVVSRIENFVLLLLFFLYVNLS